MNFPSRSFGRHAGGVVTVLAVLITVDLSLAVFTASPETIGWTLPGFGSVGATVSILSVGVWILTYVFAPALIFALGYWYGRSDPGLNDDS
jgi:hypothetical protein